MPVDPIPSDYPTLTPYLAVDGAERAIAFYGAVFGASERMRLPGAKGGIGHAELQIGQSILMLADPWPEGHFGPPQGPGHSHALHLYVADVDAVFARAIAAGATELRPVADQFYGDRSGMLRDPFGHVWSLASHIEDVSQEEMARRMAALGPG